jgi:hypothetical protein
MPIRRRGVLILAAIGAAQILQAQSLSRFALQAVNFTTTINGSFDPSVSKSGKVVRWAWGDGTYTSSNSPSKSYSAGTHTFRLMTFDTFNGVTVMNFNGRNMAGAFPSIAAFPNLTTGQFYSNAFSGPLPRFNANTKLTLLDLDTNSLSAVIPDFSLCTLLITLNLYTNGFTGTTAGSFATQKSLSTADFHANALTQAAVDQILADFVVSLGISGRVTCIVKLNGGTNSTPSAAGLASKALLVAASWTVTNN